MPPDATEALFGCESMVVGGWWDGSQEESCCAVQMMGHVDILRKLFSSTFAGMLLQGRSEIRLFFWLVWAGLGRSGLVWAVWAGGWSGRGGGLGGLGGGMVFFWVSMAPKASVVLLSSSEALTADGRRRKENSPVFGPEKKSHPTGEREKNRERAACA